MKTASISGLKARLSEYLRAVRRGEEIVVTDRGRPVARLAPLEGPALRQERVEELVDAGLARPASARLPRDFWKRPRPGDPGGLVREALIVERREGR